MELLPPQLNLHDPSFFHSFLLSDIAVLRRQRTIPLLFVHGHLGSPQQMRSMASESSREIVKRFRQTSKNSNNNNKDDDKWELWVDWHATNFNEEPSAFEPALLVSNLAIPHLKFRNIKEKKLIGGWLAFSQKSVCCIYFLSILFC